ncbi:putative hydrolase of the HAD superfamily [Dethiosulfatibacter aminovorans DSM 17477]|uniref:Putative hydrolase of the HAD superfamily n=1 Tax=Dethiosulfatibacter aminovorans DSM 17477 TaxID=1121476 RepID=A0A1M6I2B6_9FIRM|nr:HAD-IA family hydrolase [Dethiosulfatibacter aminovorans]SHJ28623.1 putative hydrolase of the HAD superfamily [Dethiosulfatibacter aminovorans DSM 17477]
MKIENIFFDAGGVLFFIRNKRDDVVRKLLLSMGYAESSVEEAVDAGNEFDRVYLMDIDWFYTWDEEEAWLKGRFDAISEYIDRDNKTLGRKLFMLTVDTIHYEMYPETVRILEELSGKYNMSVISNALPSLDWAFDHLDLRKYFQKVVISAYEGMEKPDHRIYESALLQTGYDREKTIFIDDRIENVEAAIDLGMQGYHRDRERVTLDDFAAFLEENRNEAIV